MQTLELRWRIRSADPGWPEVEVYAPSAQEAAKQGLNWYERVVVREVVVDSLGRKRKLGKETTWVKEE